MQAADVRYRNDLALTWELYFARYRRVWVQRQMWAHLVIVIEIQTENPLEMDFVQYNHVIQTFAADGTDGSFRVRILPR